MKIVTQADRSFAATLKKVALRGSTQSHAVEKSVRTILQAVQRGGDRAADEHLPEREPRGARRDEEERAHAGEEAVQDEEPHAPPPVGRLEALELALLLKSDLELGEVEVLGVEIAIADVQVVSRVSRQRGFPVPRRIPRDDADRKDERHERDDGGLERKIGRAQEAKGGAGVLDVDFQAAPGHGAGSLLPLDQLKNLLGLKAMGDVHDPFLVRFWETMLHGGSVHVPTLAVGLSTIAVVLGLMALNTALVADRQVALWLRDMKTGAEKMVMDPIDPMVTSGSKTLGVLPRYKWAKDGKSIVLAQGGKIRVKVTSAPSIELVDLDKYLTNPKVVLSRVDINKGNEQIAHGIDRVLLPLPLKPKA